MRKFYLFLLMVMNAGCLSGQTIRISDPDSLLSEWLEAAEWEAITLHPDIALDWLSELDSMVVSRTDSLRRITLLVTATSPAGSDIFGWNQGKGTIITPLSMKYRFNVSESRRYEFRLQVNRSAGDTCFRLPAANIDQQTGFGLLIRPGSHIREVIIGDYQVNSGFGVVAGSSPVFSVSLGNPVSLHRTGRGIRLGSGSTQGRYFRGIASTFSIGKSECIINVSGKSQSNEDVLGMSLKRSFSGFDVGWTAIRVNNQMAPAVKEGWNAVWQPDSGRYSRTGLWSQVRFPIGILFGEAGWSPGRGVGWMAGFRWFEVQGFSAVARWSGSSAGYPVPYSVFQYGTSQTHEAQRIITSWRYAQSRQLEWLGSAEVDLALWPGSGTHFNNPATRITQQLKYLSKNQWIASGVVQLDFGERSIGVPRKLTWKLAFDNDPKQSRNVRFRIGFRQQVQGFGDTEKKGSTADCSISTMLFSRKLILTTGFRLFTVETGSDPVYAYEPDVLYGWSAPVLTGSGTRWFVTTRCKLLKNIDIEIKITQTAYHDLKHISEGSKGGVSGKVQVGWAINQ